ncbi:MAG: hypothetical protein MI976_22065 [Pseudomonadales bacterium]|nr:hypothetical protein [Pseudomonadales bacterium]
MNSTQQNAHLSAPRQKQGSTLVQKTKNIKVSPYLVAVITKNNAPIKKESSSTSTGTLIAKPNIKRDI